MKTHGFDEMTTTMNKFHDNVETFVLTLIQKKALVLTFVMIVSLFMFWGVSRINVDNDASKSLPDSIVEMKDLAKIREIFNTQYSVIFMAQFEDETIQEKITLLNNWSEQFESVIVDGEKGVHSVAHLGKLKVPVKGGMLGVKAGEISPELSTYVLKTRIEENRDLTGNFISDDNSVAIVLVYTKTEIDRQKTLSGLQEVLRDIQMTHPNSYITGATATSWYLNRGMRANFRVLLPIAILICSIILFGIFRRISFVIAPLFIISISLIWTFGIMGFVGFDFTLLSSVIPLILFPIGLANSIHVLKSYNHFRVNGSTFEMSFVHSYANLMRAIILTSLTTFFGFASFLFSDLKWTQSFGLFTGFGVVIALFLTVLLLPLLISSHTGNESSDQSSKEHNGSEKNRRKYD